MSTPYDVSTGTYVQNFSVSAQDTVPNGVEFKPDGTKFYIVGDTGNDINEYDLSTPWDISTATFAQALQYLVRKLVLLKSDLNLMAQKCL